jgi:hypothetical protein
MVNLIGSQEEPGPVRHVANRYPQGVTTVSAGTLATVIIWVSTNVAHVSMDASAGAAFATVFAGVASFVGRKGLKGCWSAIWRGSEADD